MSYNSSYISPKCKIGTNVLIGSNSFIYGDVIIEDNCIVENNVIIGHPSLDDFKIIDKSKNVDLNELYDSISKHKVSIGKNSIIRSNSIIYSGSIIGDNFDCGHGVVIRENCVFGNDVYVFVNTEFKREVRVGNGCRLAGTICDRTIIGLFSSVYGHTVHKYNIGFGGYIEDAPTIGNGVVVGREAIIIGGITINDFTLISSNSVVIKSTKKFGLYSGNPAKFMKNRKKEEYQQLLHKINV